MDSLSQKMKRRIRAKGRGWVFTPKDFLDLGSRNAVDTTLSRITSDGFIRRLKRGLYDFPRTSPIAGLVPPSVDHVAAALARKTGDSIHLTGADAANLLGLTTQVQAQPWYLTTGPSRTCQIGKLRIRLIHSSLNAALDLSNHARMAVNAMLWIGKHGLDDKVVQYVEKVLKQSDGQRLVQALKVLPAWIAPTIKTLTT